VDSLDCVLLLYVKTGIGTKPCHSVQEKQFEVERDREKTKNVRKEKGTH